MELIREKVKLSQTVLEKLQECCVESNVIVPDKNPDILKVLQVDTTASIKKYAVKDGRLSVEGKVYADVIYLADGGEFEVKTLPVALDFTDFFDSALLGGGLHISLACDVDGAEINLINSRKIALKITVGINAEVTADTECEYIASLEGENAAYKCDEAEGYIIAADDNIEFLIKEETELPEASRRISELIKCDALISDKEVRVAGTKTIVKGAVSANVLFKTEEGTIETANARFPFTEVFETGEEIEQGMLERSINILEKSIRLSGEKTIAYEFLVRIEICAKKKVSFSFMSDCYFYGKSTDTEAEELYLESIRKLPPALLNIREIVMCGEHMPRIGLVYNVVAKPHIISTEKALGGLLVNARLDVLVLYLSDSKENPVCCQKAQIPITHKIDTDNPDDVTLMAECEHINYALTGGGVEIRAVVAISGQEKTGNRCQIITSVEKGEDIAENEIVIFFASGGEKLWDISKKYKANREYIKELNEIDEDVLLEKGRKLIIPI